MANGNIPDWLKEVVGEQPGIKDVGLPSKEAIPDWLKEVVEPPQFPPKPTVAQPSTTVVAPTVTPKAVMPTAQDLIRKIRKHPHIFTQEWFEESKALSEVLPSGEIWKKWLIENNKRFINKENEFEFWTNVLEDAGLGLAHPASRLAKELGPITVVGLGALQGAGPILRESLARAFSKMKYTTVEKVIGPKEAFDMLAAERKLGSVQQLSDETRTALLRIRRSKIPEKIFFDVRPRRFKDILDKFESFRIRRPSFGRGREAPAVEAEVPALKAPPKPVTVRPPEKPPEAPVGAIPAKPVPKPPIKPEIVGEASKYRGKTFDFVRSTEKAPKSTQFAQDIEPSGKYMIFGDPKNVKGLPNFETGKIKFDNPLVVEWKTTGKGGWKTDLSNAYGGKTGKELSRAIADDGYDGIVTIHRGETSEVVSLKGFKPPVKPVVPKPKVPKTIVEKAGEDELDRIETELRQKRFVYEQELMKARFRGEGLSEEGKQAEASLTQLSSDLEAIRTNLASSEEVRFSGFAQQMQGRVPDEEIQRELEAARAEVATDELTGLGSEKLYNTLGRRLIESKTPFSMIVMDIDNFKAINDTYGHDVGDEAIQAVANILKQSLRPDATAIRLHGDEDLAFLPATSEEDAIKIAQRISDNVEKATITSQNIKVKITAGVSEYTGDNRTLEEVFKSADKGLLHGKSTKRGEVSTEDELDKILAEDFVQEQIEKSGRDMTEEEIRDAMTAILTPPPSDLRPTSKFRLAIEKTKEIKTKFASAFDITANFDAVGAHKTGMAMKNYFGKIQLEDEKSLNLAKRLGSKRFKLSRSEMTELVFLAERPTMFAKLSPESRKKMSAPYHLVRDYFDNAFKELKKAGVLETAFPQSLIRRLEDRNVHLQSVLKKGKTKVFGRDFKKSWTKELTNNERMINSLKKGNVKFVHIPTQLWFEKVFEEEPTKAYKILSWLTARKRDTPTIQDLVNTGLIPKEDVDVRDIIVAYGRKLGKDLALSKIINSARADGLIKPIGFAPDGWQPLSTRKFPFLKGELAHPLMVNYLEDFLNSVGKGMNIGRFFGYTKSLSFNNPLYLAWNNLNQGAMAGSVLNPKMPIYAKRAIVANLKKTDEYWEASENGLFSTPFIPPFKAHMNELESMKKHAYHVNAGYKFLTHAQKLLPWKIIPSMYRLSWNIAWDVFDKTQRLQTWYYLKELGYDSAEAAETASLYHGDYARVPPTTRRIINKIFFTPTFKIAMTEMYSQMIKSSLTAMKRPFSGSMRTQTRLKQKIETTTDEENVEIEKMDKEFKRMRETSRARQFTLGLARLLAIVHGKHLYMTRIHGFEVSKVGGIPEYSRRYVRRVRVGDMDVEDLPERYRDLPEDTEMELVMPFATPQNIPLRLGYRAIASFAPSELNNMKRTVESMRWELHPIWRVASDVINNDYPNYVYDPFAERHIQAAQIAAYSIGEIVRMTSAIFEPEKLAENIASFKLMQKELSQLEAVLLKPFVYAYIRNIPEKRVRGQIRALQKEFNKFIRTIPPDDEFERERLLRRFSERVAEIDSTISNQYRYYKGFLSDRPPRMRGARGGRTGR